MASSRVMAMALHPSSEVMPRTSPVAHFLKHHDAAGAQALSGCNAVSSSRLNAVKKTRIEGETSRWTDRLPDLT
jgi:hypothetical protein